ncbi:MAG: hypothetical protein H8E55_03990 [Pelagibacterales bacterium]|nr:hypothetical protein [Pelagibacterales bacterium]
MEDIPSSDLEEVKEIKDILESKVKDSFLLETYVTCNIQVDDDLENYTDEAYDVEFVFDQEDVFDVTLKELQEYAYEKHFDLITKHNGAVIDMKDLYQYNQSLAIGFDDQVETYVSSNFQSTNPEITLMNMKVTYKLLG